MAETINLEISQNLVKPILEEKIKLAVLEAFEGKERMVSEIVNAVISQKVDAEGKVSKYDSDNKYSYVDILIRRRLNEAVRGCIGSMIEEAQPQIIAEITKQLKTKKGISDFAKAMLTATGSLFSKGGWYTSFTVDIHSSSDR